MSDSLTAGERWEARTQGPLTWLAVGFIFVYGYPIIDPDAPGPLLAACSVLSWGIWAVFAFDFVWRTWCATDRRRFITGHIPELVTVVLPMLRPLRALRVLTLANLAMRRSDSRLFVNAAQVIGGAVVLLVTLGALAMLDAERGAKGAGIDSIGDALWWAVVTITTVGYGDLYPVTVTGRLIAGVMMLIGIALVGVVTAGIAGWFVTRIQQTEDATDE